MLKTRISKYQKCYKLKVTITKINIQNVISEIWNDIDI